jgi:hypothetical protein
MVLEKMILENRPHATGLADTSEANLSELLHKMEWAPTKRLRWPTKAANVISLYQHMWDRDIEQARAKQSKILERYDDPHLYSDLTRMCCPTLQLDPDLLRMPPTEAETTRRY